MNLQQRGLDRAEGVYFNIRSDDAKQYAQGFGHAPQPAVGEGALGFWKALSKVFPKTVHQRC